MLKSARIGGGNTEFTDNWGKTGMIGERNEKTFCGSDESWEREDLELIWVWLREYPTLFVFWTRPVNMFNQGIKNTSNAKRRLNDIWSVLVDCH